MLMRLYADNFRCLTNFDLTLDEANTLLGANGTGKTSVLTAVRRIELLVVGGAKVDDVFPARDLTLSGNRGEQRFEIQSCFSGHTYDSGINSATFLVLLTNSGSSRLSNCSSVSRNRGRLSCIVPNSA